MYWFLTVSMHVFALGVSSPDGRLLFKIQTGSLNETVSFDQDFEEIMHPSSEGGLQIGVEKVRNRSSSFMLVYLDEPVLQGGFGLMTSEGNAWMAGQSIRSTTHRTVNHAYHQPGHKTNPVLDHYNEVYFEFDSVDSWRELRVGLRIRVYNDGAAFRYELHPATLGSDSVSLDILDDLSWFDPVSPFTCWPMYLDGYDSSHEALYHQLDETDLPTGELIAAPFLMEFPHRLSVAITEASLSDFPGMYLIADKVESDFRFNADLSKAGGVKGVLAKVSTPFRSPWRVMMVGESPGKLIESNLILNLNESSKLEDDSWLRFGKTTWNWWNGFYQEPVDFKVGANFETIKHYIDFCADNGIEFHAIDCADASWTWYEQSKPGFAPSDDADILTPRAELQFFRALAYAKFRGVGIRLWVHWRPLSMRLEEAMKEYAKWGVEGLMVDFLDRDDQEMVQWTEKVLQVAAEHQIRIQFHGVWKPTGLRRTYPNLVNHEGALNLEFLKWSDLCTPDHNVTVPYTRMLAGPMDYHLGGFRSVTSEHFFARNDKPFVLGTRCHHLAMYVVYDNPVPMVSDGPTAYLNEPGFDFIQQVPTTWDEISFLEGAVGEFIVIAKRKGTDWFLGAMTNDSEREIAVETDFLREGQYRVDVWSDVDALTPDLLNQTQTVINSGDIMNMTLVSGGGQVLKLTPVDP